MRAVSSFCVFVCIALWSGAALANVPPPLKIRGSSRISITKGPVIQLAEFLSTSSARQRSFPVANTFATMNYCQAVVDMGADPGVRAKVEIFANTGSFIKPSFFRYTIM